MLHLDRINCFYGNVQVLRDFSLDLAPGEVLCLLGRNGAGKTTALKAIMGLIAVRSGSIKFDDVELTSLPPHEVAKQGIARVLDLFPLLAERLQQRAGTLSGGEQQMLATARALCVEPRVMLLDEPTEGLMPLMINKILEIVGKLKEAGVATILVEQRVESALHVADRVAFIENGRSAEIVSPAELRADPSLLHQYVGVGIRKAAR